MPHPLVFDCHVKVQTVDGRTNPVTAFQTALEDLGLETELLEHQFEMAVQKFEDQHGI